MSWIATAAAIWGVYAVGDRIVGHGAGLLLSGLWATAPVAIVLFMAYSEALFSALAAWALYAVLTRQLLLASVLAFFAGLTRPLGVAVAAAVIVAVAMEFAQCRTDILTTAARRARLWGLVGTVLLAVSGWAGYVGWVSLQRRSFLGYFAVQDGWGNGVDGGRAFVGWVGHCLSDTTEPAQIGLGAVVILGVLCAFGLLALCIHDRMPLPVLVFTSMVVKTSFMTSRYFASKPRYLLPAFPLLLPLATRLTNARTQRLVLVGATALSTVVGAIWLLGSSPP